MPYTEKDLERDVLRQTNDDGPPLVYHIDARAEPGGDGTEERPFSSYREAVEAKWSWCKEHGLPESTRTTYVFAPGVYANDGMVLGNNESVATKAGS